MADVAQTPGLWGQIRIVASLRWRILRNSLRRKNNLLDLIGLIISSLFGGLLILGLCFAFYFGAYLFLSTSREYLLAYLFWAIFIFWQFFPLFVAGFGGSFEFRSLLRFPLSLSTFYLMGLAYGLADYCAVASVCWLISMIFGAAVARPDVLPVLLLVSALFLVTNVTLERLLGSWLERLLARRRTREIFFALFILLMVSVQLIAPFMERYGDSSRHWGQQLLPYLAFFPPSLAGEAVASAALHDPVGALLRAAGVSFYALLFGGLLWLRFSAQYQGEELGESAISKRPAARAMSQEGSQTDALSLLSPQVAAVLRKEFRYLTRNAFTSFLFIMPPAFVLIFTVQFSGKHPHGFPEEISRDLFFPGMMAYLILILMSQAYNSFAYEGRGIQAYFMAPLRFRDVLMGKNLMLLAVLFFELALSMVVFAYRVGLPSAPVFVATLVGIVFVVAGQLSIANWSSLSFPRKLVFGQMRSQRQSGMAVLIAFGTQILLGGICAPILFVGRWTGNPWLPAEVFALLAVAAIAGYSASLDALSEFAEKKKETLIEALCR